MRIEEIVERFNYGDVNINKLIGENERVSIVVKNNRVNKLLIIRNDGTHDLYNEFDYIRNKVNLLIKCVKAFNHDEIELKDLENESKGLMCCGCNIMYMKVGPFITSLIIEQDKKVIYEWEDDYSDY